MAGAFCAVLSLAGFMVGARVLVDNSFLTHLATGRLILERGAVPVVDPYSYTASGLPWTVQSWLPSLLYASLERLGPASLIRIANGVLCAGITAGTWRLTAEARQLTGRAALTLVPLVLGAAFWPPRPLLFGLAGMVAVLLAWKHAIPVWSLLPVAYVWVNSHGSFPLAIVFLVLAAAGSMIDGGRAPRQEAEVGLWFASGCVLAALNPIGPRILWFPVELLARREALEGVAEWTPPTFTRWPDYVFLSACGFMVVAAKRGLEWQRLLPACAFMAAGMLAVRNISVASIVMVTCVAPAFAGPLANGTGDQRNRIASLVLGVASVAMIASALVLYSGTGIVPSAYPVDAVSDLEERGLVSDKTVRLLHRDAVGNYLHYRFGDKASVFIDDRFDFYPIDLVTDHRQLLDGQDLAEIIGRHKPDAILWEADSPLSQWLRESEGWRVRESESDWIIACPVPPAALPAC